jgi:hypothetical protein
MKRFILTYGHEDNRVIWGQYSNSSSAIQWFRILSAIPEHYAYPMLIDRRKLRGVATGDKP